MSVSFRAPEFCADGALREVSMRFRGSPESGWEIEREGRPHMTLGPGYQLLRTLQCGVCSTDLARAHLPFPLPQVIGHELVGEDASGVPCVVEINASHSARGVEHGCPFCANGLATHCPDRIVLGIHDLPGGFGSWVLAPVEATLPVPDGLPLSSAVLVEPFAAALHAVETIRPRVGDVVAVLGPRRLGLLVVAALRAWSDARGLGLEIVALARRSELLERARDLGATRGHVVAGGGDALDSGLADVVVDTTGHPAGLDLAARLARREVHLKSTHGQPAGGLSHATELVVDEIGLRRFDPAGPGPARVAWLAGAEPPAAWLAAADVWRGATAAELLGRVEHDTPDGQLPRFDTAVVETAAEIDAAVRPVAGCEVALVKPRAEIQLMPGPRFEAASPLLRSIAAGGLRLSTSRCGSFRAALDLMVSQPALAGLGARMVTHRFAGDEVPRAFATAASRPCIKAVVEHARPSP